MWKLLGSNGTGRASKIRHLTAQRNDPGILSQESFLSSLRWEQRRTERSGRPFALMLVEFGVPEAAKEVLEALAETLSKSIRETDTTGWYTNGSVLGVIFTELGPPEQAAVMQSLQNRVITAATGVLSREEVSNLRFSLHFFPEDRERSGGSRSDPLVYPELVLESRHKNVSMPLKRLLDFTGSLSAIIFLAPLLVAISAAIKLTSKGPVFFRQQRVGQYGHRFTMLKFRSMYWTNDHSPHKQYVKQFIGGAGQSGQTAYKLTADSRVTTVGKFLRRASFDELPQFFNVLRGDMSLVGPRPPIPYEVESYDTWHKRRFLTAKPGITGLWQVQGRSRVKFDEMVRMDLRYAESWSLGMDVKILLRTPRAVIGGDGAY